MTNHPPGCHCEPCWQAPDYQPTRKEKILFAILTACNATANGVAYVAFGIIALIILGFLARWAYVSYWTDTHCTMVMGTRVCK